MHITVRLAWHDSGWNGKICKNPEENFYCEGDYSLLSDRIKRNKILKIEKKYSQENPDKITKNDNYGTRYIPPCYWCINAFSSHCINVIHTHPFREFDKNFRDKKWMIKDKTPPYSIFTWPFRISFSDTEEYRYPPDLDKKIEKFIKEVSDSPLALAFFYLNYSNPFSAEEMKYLLVGCGKIKKIEKPHKFSKVHRKELEEIKKKYEEQYFPDFNWAIKITLDHENIVILPYIEFLNNPEIRDEIDKWKITIEEASLIRNFKYVCELMEDDKAIYLLYRIRNSIKKIEDILKNKKLSINFKAQENIKKINNFLKNLWKKRGLYPGLSKILAFLNNPFVTPEDNEKYYKTLKEAEKITKKIRKKIQRQQEKLLDYIFSILASKKSTPQNLSKKEKEYLKDCTKNFNSYRNYSDLYSDLFKTLSFFDLTRFQIARIFLMDNPPDRVFPFKMSVSREDIVKDIVKNPYVLFEEYVPNTNYFNDRNSITLLDYPIDLFLIDFGLFPDNNFLSLKNERLQHFKEIGPHRVRALIIDYLKKQGERFGNCFEEIDDIFEGIKNKSLIYQSHFPITKDMLSQEKYLTIFKEKLSITEDKKYFYLKYVKKAEEIITDTIKELINRPDYEINTDWIENYIQEDLERIKKEDTILYNKIEKEKEVFENQRKRCFENAMKHSFCIISGKAGTGKSFAVVKIVEELEKRNEKVILLAPTGRAALRLNQLIKDREQIKTEAKTIDMFLCENGYYEYSIEDFKAPEKIQKIKSLGKINIILDEASMIDLEKLAFLLSIFQTSDIKRLILVGDESQLPPIGLGKPFFDIVEHITTAEKLKNKHYVRFTLNCRQRFDDTIVQIAEVFRRENKYYSEIINKIKTEGEVSEGVVVEFWKNKDELYKKIMQKLEDVLKEELKEVNDKKNLSVAERICLLFGLYETGYVKKNDPKTLELEKFQIITPYRGEYFGTFGINKLFSEIYKKKFRNREIYRSKFFHAEKIIRIENWYKWDNQKKKKSLLLANGSIGVICSKNSKACLYFPDALEREIWEIDDEESFERAHAITIHKSQGTQFKNVFVIIPSEKRTLLSTELLYTALTRSTGKLYLFIQRKEEDDLIEYIRRRSDIAQRKTSILKNPDEFINYRPDPNNTDILVRSKAEYIIYRTLLEKKNKGEIKDFKYEDKENQLGLTPGPDFTIINLNGKVYYWEHLGIIDTEDYYKRWKKRLEIYKTYNCIDNLLTTDDKDGIKQEIIEKILEDINKNMISGGKTEFSYHHYKLY